MERDRGIPTGLPRIDGKALDSVLTALQVDDKEKFIMLTFSPMFLRDIFLHAGLEVLGPKRTTSVEKRQEFRYGAAYFYTILKGLEKKEYKLPKIKMGLIDSLRSEMQRGEGQILSRENILEENPFLEKVFAGLSPIEEEGARAVYSLKRKQYLSTSIGSSVKTNFALAVFGEIFRRGRLK